MAIPLPCISWLNQFDLMNFQSNAPKNLSFYICSSDKIDFLLGPIITTFSPVALYFFFYLAIQADNLREIVTATYYLR